MNNRRISLSVQKLITKGKRSAFRKYFYFICDHIRLVHICLVKQQGAVKHSYTEASHYVRSKRTNLLLTRPAPPTHLVSPADCKRTTRCCDSKGTSQEVWRKDDTYANACPWGQHCRLWESKEGMFITAECRLYEDSRPPINDHAPLFFTFIQMQQRRN